MTEGGRKNGGGNFFFESHGKQLGGCKGKRINPLTAQRNA